MTQPYEPDREPPAWTAPPPGYQPGNPPPGYQPGNPPPGYPPPGYGQPGYPPPGYPPPGYGQPGPPGYGSPPPSGTSGRNNRMILLIAAVVLVLVAAGAVALFVLSGNGTKKTGDKQQIAQTAQTFLQALGTDDPGTFCPHWDPANLKQELTQNSISSCDHLTLTNAQTKALYKTIKVRDVSAIIVTGDTAVVPRDAFTPSKPSDLKMVKESDGEWKAAFYNG
ncbi:MAG: hypothetical protein ACRDVG_13630 [Jatrophihabitantaceae bacterium]